MPDRQRGIEGREAGEYNGTQRVRRQGDSEGESGRKGRNKQLNREKERQE